MRAAKYIAGAALVALSLQTQAQVHVGPEVGLNVNTMITKIDGRQYNNQFVVGGRAGVALDISVDDNFFIQTSVGLGFMNGGKSDFRSYHSAGNGVPTSITDEREYRLYTINIPVYFTHKVNFEYNRNTLIFGAGPVINLHVGGDYNRTYTTTMNGVPRPVYDNRALKTGPNWGEHDTRMFELAAAAMVGYELTSGFNVRLHYGVGITNMAPGGDKDHHFRSHGGGLSLSYYINKNKGY